MKDTITPLPWKRSGDSIINGHGTICTLWKPDKFTKGSQRANAKYIVRAANALPECVKALEALLANPMSSREADIARMKAIDALALARGERGKG